MIEHPAFASRRGLHTGELDTTYGVSNIKEASRLPAFAVHGERVAYRRFDTEAVQHCAEHFIVIEPVNERFIERHLVRQRPVYNTLVQVRRAQSPNLARDHDVVAGI